MHFLLYQCKLRESLESRVHTLARLVTSKQRRHEIRTQYKVYNLL